MMQATIKKREIFDFTIGGQTFTGFEKVSGWEGFTKFKNDKGIIIAMTSDNDALAVLKKFWNPEGKDQPIFIVKCSPCFTTEGKTK